MLVKAQVDVSTHDEVKEGNLCLMTLNVCVEADNELDGTLIAIQMAAAFGMPTAARMII